MTHQLHSYNISTHKPMYLINSLGILDRTQVLILSHTTINSARLIFSSLRFQHITPLLRQLHWLKAPERIAFKQSVLMYKCLHGSAPAGELCQVADDEARQRLHSSSSSLLIVRHPTPHRR